MRSSLDPETVLRYTEAEWRAFVLGPATGSSTWSRRAPRRAERRTRPGGRASVCRPPGRVRQPVIDRTDAYTSKTAGAGGTGVSGPVWA